MKYKVRDKVRVIPDLIEGDKRFPDTGVTEEMETLQGKIVTITDIYGDKGYLIHEDGWEFIWAESMFSGIAEFTLDDLETRMVVETRNGYRYLVLRDQKEICAMRSDGEHRMKLMGGGYLDHSTDMYYPHDADLDIVKIYPKVNVFHDVATVRNPIWERKENSQEAATSQES